MAKKLSRTKKSPKTPRPSPPFYNPYAPSRLRQALAWLLGRPLGHVLVILLLAATLLGTLASAYQARPIVRDLIVASVAHQMAGEEIPWEIERSSSEVAKVWDTGTNAPALVEMAYEIVPFFAMENLTGQGVYPKVLILAPYLNYQSFIVAGNAGAGLIFLNERYVDDKADVLATLTHELIHVQGGFFIEAPKGVSGMERSYFVESRTQSATLEVTAAMCRFGEEAACRAFWTEIESFTRRSVQAKALRLGAPWLYELWADLVLRSTEDLSRAEKMDRFWAAARVEQRQIVERYGELPWNEQVIPGICGEPLQTGLFRYLSWPEDHPAKVVLAMPFDDTRVELGWLLTKFICANR